MPDHKELFYKSQAAIADTLDILDEIRASLIEFMQECEEEVISDDDSHNREND